MSMGSTLEDLCRLFHIKDSSDASKHTVVYEKVGELCFLMAQMETSTEALKIDDEKSLGSCKQWIEKAIDCYLKAMSEFQQEDDAWKRLDASLMKILDWIQSVNYKSSLLKAFSRSIDEGPPCSAAAGVYKYMGSIPYSKGTRMIRGFKGRFENNDYKACFSLMKESLHLFQRSSNLYHSLQIECSTDLKFFAEFMKGLSGQTQFVMNTMKVCMELVDLVSKRARVHAFNACIQSWFNQSQQLFQSLPLGFEVCSRATDILLDLKYALQAQQLDVLQIFFKAFNLIMAFNGSNYSSYSFQTELSNYFTKKEKHAARIVEVEESDAKILLRLEEKIRALCLKGKKSCAESYLRYIYEEHPHPNPKWMLGSISTLEETKEALRKAIFHYHPDTNMKHGQEWVLLCNEITKILNNYNANYK